MRAAWTKTALYPGICGICGERINIGDPIVKRPGKYRSGFVHTGCGREASE